MKGTRYIYGVFVGSTWTTVSTMYDALRLFNTYKHRGVPVEVRRLPTAPYRDERGAISFDAPTFRVLSDSVRSN